MRFRHLSLSIGRKRNIVTVNLTVKLNLSASIAVYRPQAELSGGRSDGKRVVRWGKSNHCQMLIGAGDN
jgi:hypothetical protein